MNCPYHKLSRFTGIKKGNYIYLFMNCGCAIRTNLDKDRYMHYQMLYHTEHLKFLKLR